MLYVANIGSFGERSIQPLMIVSASKKPYPVMGKVSDDRNHMLRNKEGM